jgi:hypothetical protein
VATLVTIQSLKKNADNHTPDFEGGHPYGDVSTFVTDFAIKVHMVQ